MLGLEKSKLPPWWGQTWPKLDLQRSWKGKWRSLKAIIPEELCQLDGDQNQKTGCGPVEELERPARLQPHVVNQELCRNLSNFMSTQQIMWYTTQRQKVVESDLVQWGTVLFISRLSASFIGLLRHGYYFTISLLFLYFFWQDSTFFLILQNMLKGIMVHTIKKSNFYDLRLADKLVPLKTLNFTPVTNL